ncbi:hypothetical protein [Pseudomonas sp. URMO17WK12:I11]|uniref:hypothetical protein n=1 Tax=Pseudomonas sp. URMO17WK12:I11 TaxID=1283291 RepID=UPI0011A04FF5|nr:hypothetical protein [Pseudomonas sp. URMO17WK12:I11]
MNELLRHILAHCADDLSTGLIVGAGAGSQLDDWRRLGCRQLLLAEAHPRLAEELGPRLRQDQGEFLLALAVTAENQPMATLQVLNNLAYSSLNPAADLLTYYPNLRRGEALEVPARTLEAIIADQALDGQQTHALLLAAPGQALQLLQATPQVSLQSFTWVIIDCNSEPLYQNEASGPEVITWMESIGFELVADNPDAIFPHSQLLFERNASRITQKLLESEIVQLHSQASLGAGFSNEGVQMSHESDPEIANLAKLVHEQEQRLDQLTRENTRLASVVEAIQTENAELQQSLEHEADRALACQSQIEALGIERNELAKACEMLEQKHASLTTVYDDQARQVTDLRAELTALGGQNAELTRLYEALKSQHAELISACDLQTQKANDCQARLDAQHKAACDLTAERDALAQENTRLSETCEAQVALANDRQAQLQTASVHSAQQQKALAEQREAADANLRNVKTLEHEAVNYKHRQRLLEEELVKSEAQLELIKDLLLREPGL